MLIKCPECGLDVSTAAPACPHCGYPIDQHMQKLRDEEEERAFSAEVERLTAQIKPVEFKVPDPRAKVCIKCSRPFFYCGNINNESYGKPLCQCRYGSHKYPGVEVDYPALQVGAFRGSKYIYEYCVVPNNIGDQDSREYKEYVEGLYAGIHTFEETQKRIGNPNWKIVAYPPDEKYFDVHGVDKPIIRPQQVVQRVPVCPICGSANLAKIPETRKALRVSLFGLLGAGDVGKTWECRNCGSKF